uniref:Fe2OG dioxygenase domain-containing protein n=1 Tax=Romanomermis culicivorax TaxID=13658 RepID=A0A915JWN2_ROMCU
MMLPVEKIFQFGKTFWSLNENRKIQFAKCRSSIGGYVGEGVEKLDAGSGRRELREAFNFCLDDETCIRVDQVVPNFYENMSSFYQYCHILSSAVLSIIERYLNVEEGVDFLTKWHPVQGTATTLRLLHYPPVPLQILDSSSTRCGEHSDYGSLTLLFQDMIGGLEVLKSSLILLYKKHRVRLPENRNLWSLERYSIAFFVHPLDECVIECLDGSKKYPPVTAGQYLLDKYAQTY